MCVAHKIRIPIMSNAGKDFGLRPRAGRGTGRGSNRTTTQVNPWIRVTNDNTPGPRAEPVPPQRGNITNKFTTFCVIALGYPRNKPPPPKVALMRQFLVILRMGDDQVAILPYDDTSQENSISAAAHVPTTPAASAIYFPEFTHYLKRHRTKGRITSAIPMWLIKSTVFSELRANDYRINPTSLKCQDSEKCGYFLYTHPYMTQQLDFRQVLDPILRDDWDEHKDYEYDFQAEKLSVTFNEQTGTAKVFLIRSSPKFTSKLQQTLTRIYADDSDTNLETLHRYKFVPLTSTAVVSDEMQVGLLRSQ